MEEEDEATRRAIAESLKMKCQFCHTIFESLNELQLHQVNRCPAIEASNNSCAADKHVRNDKDTTSVIERSQRSATMSEEHTHRQSTTTENARSYTITNYCLNETKSLNKKSKACNRDPYHVQEHRNNAVITLNTASFEYFRHVLKGHLQSCQRYVIEDEPKYDIEKRVVQDIVRVFNRGNDKTHLFTINLYRTKCRVLINGPSYETFLLNDLVDIERQISNAHETITAANENMRKAIAECISSRKVMFTTDHQSRTSAKIRSSRRSNERESKERKVYGTRSQSQADESSKEVSAPINNQNRKSGHHLRFDVDRQIPAEENVTIHNQTSDLEEAVSEDVVPSQVVEGVLQPAVQRERDETQMKTEDDKRRQVAERIVLDALQFCIQTLQNKQEKTTPSEETTKEHVCEEMTGSSLELPKPTLGSGRPKRTIIKPSKLREGVVKPTEKIVKQPPKSTNIQKVYCTCKQPWSVEDGDNMTYCEVCKEWYHYECAGVIREKVDEIEKFVCMKCSMELLIQNTQINKENQTLKSTLNAPTSTKNMGIPADLKNKTKEIEKLRENIEDLKANHKNELDSRQNSLESLAAQNSKLLKEQGKQTTKIEALNQQIQELGAKNAKICDENKAHIEFIKTSLNGDKSTAEQITELQETNQDMKATIAAKNKQIEEMGNEMTSDGQKKKIASMKKEIESLTAGIRSLESSMSTLQTSSKIIAEELKVAKANYQRECELNNILMKKISNSNEICHNGPSSSSGDDKHTQRTSQDERDATENLVNSEDAITEQTVEQQPIKDNSRRPESHKSEKREERGMCCYEFHDVGSCSFKERCMFNHKIDQSSRNNSRLAEQMEKLYQESRAKLEAGRNLPKICVNAFFNQGECTFRNTRKGCKFSHEISEEMKSNAAIVSRMERIRERKKSPTNLRRVCYYEVLGTCKRREQCMFNHSIPDNVKSNPEVIEAAKSFTLKRKLSDNMTREPREPIDTENQTHSSHANRTLRNIPRHTLPSTSKQSLQSPPPPPLRCPKNAVVQPNTDQVGSINVSLQQPTENIERISLPYSSHAAQPQHNIPYNTISTSKQCLQPPISTLQPQLNQQNSVQHKQNATPFLWDMRRTMQNQGHQETNQKTTVMYPEMYPNQYNTWTPHTQVMESTHNFQPLIDTQNFHPQYTGMAY